MKVKRMMKIDDNEQSNEDNSEANIEMQSTDTNIEQSVSLNKVKKMGDDSSDNEMDYIPKIDSLKIYKHIRSIIIIMMKLLCR